MFSTKILVGGVARNTSTVATAIAAEWPRWRWSNSLSAVPNEALMRRVHHVDGVDLVEDEVGEEAHPHEAGGEPGHALVAPQQPMKKTQP